MFSWLLLLFCSGTQLRHTNAYGYIEEHSGLVEGDIMLPAGRKASEQLRSAVRIQSQLWPKGIVPYEISNDFLPSERAQIGNAMRQFHNKSCIRWRRRREATAKRPAETPFVRFMKGNGCWSYIGRVSSGFLYGVGGQYGQNISLDTGCTARLGTVLHEMLHALGFFHEQSRWDRNLYVTVKWANVIPERQSNFAKFSPFTIQNIAPYDYGDFISAKAFTRNGKATLVAKTNPNRVKLGQRFGFSDIDLMELRNLYGCAIDKTANPVIPTPIEIVLYILAGFSVVGLTAVGVLYSPNGSFQS